LAGDVDDYGKEIDGDIWEGKRTLMLIRLLQRANDAERQRALDFLSLSRSDRREPDVRWIRERMDAHGCLEYARQVAHALAGAAQQEFSLIYGDLPESRDKRFIADLPVWVLERT
jgi:geranylgeranyl diphosphate synthase type II